MRMSVGLMMMIMAACLAVPAAAADDPTIAAQIHRMMEGFNKGDIAAVKALHTAAPTIVDNVAPFRWTGPKAFDSWIADLGKSDAAASKTGGQVWFGDPVDESVAGARAYVVTPCSYTFMQKGRKMREAGFIAFTMIKAGKEWKVESWSWASPHAVAAK